MPNILVKNDVLINVNEAVTVTMPEQITNRPHVFIGFTFLRDSEGTLVPVTPTGGTITIEAKTFNNPENAEPLKDGTLIDATIAPVTLSAAANITSFVVTTAGITGNVDKIRIKTSSNES